MIEDALNHDEVVPLVLTTNEQTPGHGPGFRRFAATTMSPGDVARARSRF